GAGEQRGGDRGLRGRWRGSARGRRDDRRHEGVRRLRARSGRCRASVASCPGGRSGLRRAGVRQVRSRLGALRRVRPRSRGHHMSQVEKRRSAVPATFEWEYASAPEARDIVRIRGRYGLYIGGEEVEPRTGEWFESISPSTEESLFEVALAGEEDVGLAVEAARDAFANGWSVLPSSERAKYLFRLARLIQERSRELA